MVGLAVALVLFLAPLAYSPGPGNLFFAANGARFGFRATLLANLGYHAATWCVTLAIGFGFLGVIEAAPQVFGALKFAGAAYVLWLASKLVRKGLLGSGAEARPARFWDGAMLLLLNPKAYVIIALMFTQFLGGAEDGQLALVFLIATIFTLNNYVAFTVWTTLGDALAQRFRNPDSARWLNIGFGGMLAVVALWMVLV
jgi:threonine/homoserine/homoserine lactone efflux protein